MHKMLLSADSFGSRLRYLRSLRHLTQMELAEAVGLSLKQISRIERGLSSPSFAVIKKISQALDTNMVSLFLYQDGLPPAACPDPPGVLSQEVAGRSRDLCISVCIGTCTLESLAGKMIWSASIYNILGYRPFSVAPSLRRFLEHVARGHRDVVEAFFINARQASKADKSIIAMLIRKDSTKRVAEIIAEHSTPLPDSTQDIQFIVRDVTECVVMQRAFSQSRQQLEQYAQDKNQELMSALDQYRQEELQRKADDERQRIFEHMVNSSQAPQAFVNKGGIIATINNAYERLAGRPAEQLIGRRYDAVLIERWGQKFFKKTLNPLIKNALNHGKRGVHQGWLDYAQQGRRYTETSYTPCEQNGVIEGMIVTLHDSTEIMSAQEQLRKSQEFYQKMVETANEGLAILDRHLRITFINSQIDALLGFNATEMLGASALDFFHPEELEHVSLQILRRREGRKGKYTARLVHKGGQTLWAQISAVPLYDAHGNFDGSLAMFMDVEVLKNAQVDLQSKVQELDALFSAAHDLLVISRKDGAILSLNPAWEIILGHPPVELQKHGFLPFVHPKDVQKTTAYFERAAEKTKTMLINRLRAKCGGYRTIEWHGQGVGELFYGVGRDITCADRRRRSRPGNPTFACSDWEICQSRSNVPVSIRFAAQGDEQYP